MKNCAVPSATWFIPLQIRLSSFLAQQMDVKDICVSIVYRKRVSQALEALKKAFAPIAGAQWIRIHMRSLPLTRTCPLCRTSFLLRMQR